MTDKSSKLQRYEPEGYPVFITTSIFQKKPIFEDPSHCQALSTLIFDLRDEHNVKVLSFVIMPDHMHLVLFAQKQKEISRYMQALKRRSARIINFARKSQGSVWLHRYFDRALRSERELKNAIEYVHYNPVKAGMVSEPDGYPYSSANGGWKTDLEEYLTGKFHVNL
ncbi:MAG: transposase [candidate division Zixibacteria bacterium]|nr:transposase [candidate division Zixibacteria bacterium]